MVWYFVKHRDNNNNNFIGYVEIQFLYEMCGACSTNGRDEKCIQLFGWKT